jgi:hypothetical protein
MRPLSCISVGRLLMPIWALASLPGCETPGPGARTIPEVPESIRWTLSVNGLLVGIEVPPTPFVFEPMPNWTGPLVTEERHPEGGTVVKVHPGGFWDPAAVLRIFVRNTSDQVILWSRERAAWHVSLSAPASVQPHELPGSKPPPLWTGPIPLEPGATSTLEFPVSEIGDLWPLVPAGQYVVTVSYLPTDLTHRARGGEGNYTHPYDVPGFWTGVIETPPVVITVQHAAAR